MDKKTIFSGIQPSGNLTLGNYLGALKSWVDLQDDYNCYYCVVDMHAITVRQDPAALRRRCADVLSLLIAAGLDPEKNTMFVQSHVSAHAELTWILNCYTYMGELNRMTQFKDKCAKHADNINSGLYTYPVLMASDILLYQTDLVPVGIDQKQHLELTRDIAERFNNIYGDVFTIPEPYIPKVGAKIMSLQEPEKKMSKSDENPNAYIALMDTPDSVRAKIRRAVTDSDGEIRYDPENKPGVSNLLSIYGAIKGISPEEAQNDFVNMGYGALKEGVTESVLSVLVPLQQKYNEIRSNKPFLNEIMQNGAQRASYVANKVLAKVQKKVGFGLKKL